MFVTWIKLFQFLEKYAREKRTWRKRCWLIRWTNKKNWKDFVPFRFVLFERILFKKENGKINERTVFNNGIHQIFIRDTIYSKKKKEEEEKRQEKIKKKKRKSVGYRASFPVIEASHLIIKVVVICIAIYLGDSSESFSSPYPGQRPAERTIIR